MTDQEFMRRAIWLAERGRGWTNPNPIVGAVIVKDGRILGEGYHVHFGGLHAERNAIASLTEPAQGATMDATLYRGDFGTRDCAGGDWLPGSESEGGREGGSVFARGGSDRGGGFFARRV